MAQLRQRPRLPQPRPRRPKPRQPRPRQPVAPAAKTPVTTTTVVAAKSSAVATARLQLRRLWWRHENNGGQKRPAPRRADAAKPPSVIAVKPTQADQERRRNYNQGPGKSAGGEGDSDRPGGEANGRKAEAFRPKVLGRMAAEIHL